MEIRIAAAEDIAAVQKLWREYWASLGLPLDFQGFEEECRALPGGYLLWIAVSDGQAVGTVALRRLSEEACEAKRLFVRPAHQGKGIGRALLRQLIEDAGAYQALYADTLPSMSAALRLYRDFGFKQVGPYSAKPTPGALYLELKLPPTSAPTTK